MIAPIATIIIAIKVRDQLLHISEHKTHVVVILWF